MSIKYVSVDTITNKVETLTLTTPSATVALTDTGASLHTDFPWTEESSTLQFGGTSVATTFMKAINPLGTAATFTAGNLFLRVLASGEPQNFSYATFTQTNNLVKVTGIDVSGLVLDDDGVNKVFYEIVAPKGQLRVSLGGKHFTTDVVDSANLSAAALRTAIATDSRFTVAAATNNVITVTGDNSAEDFIAQFEVGSSDFVGTLATTTAFKLISKEFHNVTNIDSDSATGIITARYIKGATDTLVPHSVTGTILNVKRQSRTRLEDDVLKSYKK